jgi:ribosomal protein S18 acetylase RimI-like enzyme
MPGSPVDRESHGAGTRVLQETTHCKGGDFSKESRSLNPTAAGAPVRRHNDTVTTDGTEAHDDSVTFRTGTTADIVSVLDLWVAAGAPPTSTDDPPSVSALMARDPDALLIAEIGGRAVGTLIVTWDGWRGNMYRLAVLPEFRRRGIATNLVRHAERRLLALGCLRVQALVVAADDRAGAFWTGVGYNADSLNRHVRSLDGVRS